MGKDVTILGLGGKNCKLGSRLICHKDIKSKLSGGRARICNNGKIEIMTIPPAFKSPRGDLPQCIYEGVKFCEGNTVKDYRQWFIEHKCESGTVIYRNLITGLEVVTDQVVESRGV